MYIFKKIILKMLQKQSLVYPNPYQYWKHISLPVWRLALPRVVAPPPQTVYQQGQDMADPLESVCVVVLVLGRVDLLGRRRVPATQVTHNNDNLSPESVHTYECSRSVITLIGTGMCLSMGTAYGWGIGMPMCLVIVVW